MDKIQKVLTKIGRKDLAQKYYNKISSNKFVVKIETLTSKYSNEASKVVEKSEFDDKKEADKYKRKLMKKYKLINHGGYIVNYKDGVELTTNY